MQTHDVEYAGFWVRTAATIIDSILSVIVTFPLLLLVYGPSYFTDPEPTLVAGIGDILISYGLPAVLVIGFWIAKQATPGKMIVNVYIVDEKAGMPPSTGQYIGRYLAYFLSAIPLCLGFIWVAFDAQKQGWHDKLAGTLVVVKPRNR